MVSGTHSDEVDPFSSRTHVSVSLGCGKRGAAFCTGPDTVKLFFTGVHLSSQVRKLRPRDRAVAPWSPQGLGPVPSPGPFWAQHTACPEPPFPYFYFSTNLRDHPGGRYQRPSRRNTLSASSRRPGGLGVLSRGNGEEINFREFPGRL